MNIKEKKKKTKNKKNVIDLSNEVINSHQNQYEKFILIKFFDQNKELDKILKLNNGNMILRKMDDYIIKKNYS